MHKKGIELELALQGSTRLVVPRSTKLFEDKVTTMKSTMALNAYFQRAQHEGWMGSNKDEHITMVPPPTPSIPMLHHLLC